MAFYAAKAQHVRLHLGPAKRELPVLLKAGATLPCKMVELQDQLVMHAELKQLESKIAQFIRLLVSKIVQTVISICLNCRSHHHGFQMLSA